MAAEVDLTGAGIVAFLLGHVRTEPGQSIWFELRDGNLRYIIGASNANK